MDHLAGALGAPARAQQRAATRWERAITETGARWAHTDTDTDAGDGPDPGPGAAARGV